MHCSCLTLFSFFQNKKCSRINHGWCRHNLPVIYIGQLAGNYCTSVETLLRFLKPEQTQGEGLPFSVIAGPPEIESGVIYNKRIFKELTQKCIFLSLTCFAFVGLTSSYIVRVGCRGAVLSQCFRPPSHLKHRRRGLRLDRVATRPRHIVII